MALLARVPARDATPDENTVAKVWRQVMEGSRSVASHTSPKGLLLTAASIGAVGLWWAKPWRLLLKPRVLAVVVPPLAVFGLKRVPMRVWMRLATRLVRIGFAGRDRKKRLARGDAPTARGRR